MAVLRKIALALLLAASAGVLLMAAWELYNYRQFAYLPLQESGFTTGSDRARVLQNHMDLMTKRVGDMELLILILLGTSGLYAIVFVASSYFSATSFARQADQTIGHIQDQIGLAMGDLRELQEEKLGQTRSYEIQYRRAARRSRTEQDHSRMGVRGVLHQIGYPFVQRQQDAIFSKRCGQNDQIGRSRQALVDDCVGVVARQMQIRNKIDRQVLVDLELHRTCKGISRSSCANSAAYASAASMCSGRREG